MMFIKALSISMIIASLLGLLLIAIEFYNSLTVEYRPIVLGILAFCTLVATVYGILWLEKNPMPDSED